MPTREAASAPFWGRQRDLDAILAVAAEAESGAGRVLLLHGDAGVGKSTLLRHVSRQLAEEGRFFVLRYQSIANGGNFVEGIDRFLGTLGRPRADVEAAAREFMRRHQADDEPEVQRLTELLRPSGQGGDPAARQQAAFALSVRTIRRIAQRRPVQLTMDDIALAGSVGTAFLEHFLFEVSFEPFPVLIACTWRDSDNNPGFLRGLARSDRYEGRDRVTLPVGPLNQGEVVQGLVDGFGLDRAGAARIATRSGGNPLFARLLVDAGAEGEPTGKLPERLKGMLQASLDSALRESHDPKRTRRLLELLATFGNRIELALLERVPGLDPHIDLEDTVDELVDAGLLAELGAGASSSLIFTHGLHRDAVLETTTARRQRRLHAQAASVLQGWAAAGGPRLAVRIARHLEAAAESGALNAWLAAMDEEAGRGDALSAVQCGVRALRSLPERDARRDALAVELGRLQSETGDLDGAEALLRPLIDRADVHLAMAAGEVLAGVLENRADARPWTALLEQLEPIASRGGPDERRAWQRCAAIWFNAMGKPREAAKAAKAALDGAPAGHETRIAAQRLAFSCMVLGQPAEARAAAELAMAHAGEHPDHRARALRALGTVEFHAGNIDAARRHLGESLELVRTSGRSARVPLALMDRAMVELRAGDIDGAREGLREAARAARASGVGWVEVRAGFREMLCDLLQGRTEGVRQRVDLLLPDGGGASLGHLVRVRGAFLAWLALRDGRPEDALIELKPSEPLERSPALPEVAWLCEALAHAFRQLGRPEAERFDAVALGLWRRCGQPD